MACEYWNRSAARPASRSSKAFPPSSERPRTCNTSSSSADRCSWTWGGGRAGRPDGSRRLRHDLDAARARRQRLHRRRAALQLPRPQRRAAHPPGRSGADRRSAEDPRQARRAWRGAGTDTCLAFGGVWIALPSLRAPSGQSDAAGQRPFDAFDPTISYGLDAPAGADPTGIWWIRTSPGRPLGRPPEATLLRPARVRRAPIPERPQHRAEGPPLVGQRVLRPWGVLSVELPRDDPVLEQTTEPARERIRADPLERALEILKLPGPLEQEVSQDQNRPGFADDVERASDWAGGAVTRGHRAQS